MFQVLKIGMFQALKTSDGNDWNITNGNYMFNDCTSLIGGRNTAYNSDIIGKDYARIDETDAPGYFTEIISKINIIDFKYTGYP